MVGVEVAKTRGLGYSGYTYETQKKVEMDAKYLVQEIRSRPFFINSKEKHAKASENFRQVQLHFGRIIFHI